MKTLDDVGGVLERLPGNPGDWAGCDADGTLWAADVAEIVWKAAIRERWFLPEAKEFMAASVEHLGAQSTGDPHSDAERVWSLYMADKADDWTVLKAMTGCYAGYTVGDLQDRAFEVLAAELAPKTYVTTAPLFAGLRERGLEVVVITGSPGFLVEVALRAIGISNPPPVLGVALERDGDRLTAEIQEPITWEAGKVQAWRKHAGAEARLSVAFGDSPGDLALLRAAEDARVLVQPRPVLRRTAEAEPGPWCELRPGSTRDGTPVIPPTSNRLL